MSSIRQSTARISKHLESRGITLVLVDIGASLEPFKAFRPLLSHATYIGFDPDQREVRDVGTSSGRMAIVDRAVVTDPAQTSVRFYLTRNPTCSSTLPPRKEALEPYLHAYRFEVVDTADVGGTTLDNALESVSINRMDWIKLDTQGTDLRLLNSMSGSLWHGLMAVDAEPGFDRYYEGEDTFAELHEEMVKRGFWLSDLTVTNGVRLRHSVFDQLLGARSRVSRLAYEFTLKSSPTAAGPRYLRTVESLKEASATQEDYFRLWACAWFSGNFPFALDVIAACLTEHGSDDIVDVLAELTVRRNRMDAWLGSWRLLKKLSWQNVKRLVSKPY